MRLFGDHSCKSWSDFRPTIRPTVEGVKCQPIISLKREVLFQTEKEQMDPGATVSPRRGAVPRLRNDWPMNAGSAFGSGLSSGCLGSSQAGPLAPDFTS